MFPLHRTSLIGWNSSSQSPIWTWCYTGLTNLSYTHFCVLFQASITAIQTLYMIFLCIHTPFSLFFRAKQLSFSSRLLPIFSLITCMTQQPWHDTPTKSYHTSQTIFSTNDIISPPGNNFQFGCINTHSYLCKRQFGRTITSP
jgi:hypothetical protein